MEEYAVSLWNGKYLQDMSREELLVMMVILLSELDDEELINKCCEFANNYYRR